MTDFVVTITDPVQLAGITWAREQYNASLPPPAPPPDTVMGGLAATVEEMQATLDDDQAYVQWVMERAAISYADQQLRDEHRQNYETELAARSSTRGSARRMTDA